MWREPRHKAPSVRRKQYLSFNFNQLWPVTCIWSIKIRWYNIKKKFLHVLTVRWKPSHLYMKPCWVNLIFWLTWQLHSPQIWCYRECVDMNEIRPRVCHLWGWVVCVGVILLRDVGGRQSEVRIQTQSLMEINWKCFGWSPCQILGKTASPQGYQNTPNQLLKLYKEHGSQADSKKFLIKAIIPQHTWRKKTTLMWQTLLKRWMNWLT